MATEVLYSSTCPASAALSRQLVQHQFAKDFDPGQPLDRGLVLAWLGSEQGIVATPHAQRSVARISERPADDSPISLLALLDRVERALGTPVQAAVKRGDEQAFALANSGNLMFCRMPRDASTRRWKPTPASSASTHAWNIWKACIPTMPWHTSASSLAAPAQGIQEAPSPWHERRADDVQCGLCAIRAANCRDIKRHARGHAARQAPANVRLARSLTFDRLLDFHGNVEEFLMYRECAAHSVGVDFGMAY